MSKRLRRKHSKPPTPPSSDWSHEATERMLENLTPGERGVLRQRFGIARRPIDPDDQAWGQPLGTQRGEKGARRLVVWLTEEEHRDLKVEAAKQSTTMTALVLDALKAIRNVVTTHGTAPNPGSAK